MYKILNASNEDYNFLYNLNKITMKVYVKKIWGWNEHVQKELFAMKFNPDIYNIKFLLKI